MTPLNKYSYSLMYKETVKDMTNKEAKLQVKELKALSVNFDLVKCITLSGELERMNTEIIIPKTNHKLDRKYVNTIKSILKILSN